MVLFVSFVGECGVVMWLIRTSGEDYPEEPEQEWPEVRILKLRGGGVQDDEPPDDELPYDEMEDQPISPSHHLRRYLDGVQDLD
jgi:hypothetical protein